MRDIEVAILNEAHTRPSGMMMFLAKLTQRGHNIKNMEDLMKLYNSTVYEKPSGSEIIKAVSDMPHGTIKRFAPITIAIVGASRRFLAQARTHQVGLDYVSASLQYSNYSGAAQFCVPYELIKKDSEISHEDWIPGFTSSFFEQAYIDGCAKDMEDYKNLIAAGISNDVAGYKAPQGLRNILIIQGNHQAWDYFIRLRTCNRNTEETQYVTMLIWEMLKNLSNDGDDLFSHAGPDCLFGQCREGKMCCGNKIPQMHVSDLIKWKWPLITTEDDM